MTRALWIDPLGTDVFDEPIREELGPRRPAQVGAGDARQRAPVRPFKFAELLGELARLGCRTSEAGGYAPAPRDEAAALMPDLERSRLGVLEGSHGEVVTRH